MKIIFLDIDGVLNSERSFLAYGGYPWPDDILSWNKFDRIAVSMIRKLCEATGAQIVLSSSWRSELKTTVLSEYLSLPIIDKTTDHTEGWCHHKMRGYQINYWINSNDVDSYVIIDDMDEVMDIQREFFIHVDSNNGFSYHNYLDAGKILGYQRREQNGEDS
jgi:hypothetical protein